MICDVHTHTIYCDGENTPEEMLIAAINKGLKSYGFSSHAHLPYDESWNMSHSSQKKYIQEILDLKDKYKDKIDVLLGIEYDLYSDSDLSQFDYVIGSCHCIIKDDKYLSVDCSEKVYLECVNEAFGGDHYAFVKEYFNTMSTADQKVDSTFYGHFDIINKFNKNFKFFDENDVRYTEPMYSALEKLAKSKKPFELNTSAIYRHSDTEPTCSAVKWLTALSEMGGQIIINSDAHSSERIGYNFDRASKLAKKCGFKSVMALTSSGFSEILVP